MGENTAVTPVTMQVWNLSCDSSAKKRHKNSRDLRTNQGPAIPRGLSEYPRNAQGSGFKLASLALLSKIPWHFRLRVYFLQSVQAGL